MGFNYPVKILSSVEDYVIEKNDVFICALGDTQFKKKYVSNILKKGGEFINLIYPTSIINNNVKLGRGIIICAFSSIRKECNFEDFVTMQPYTPIGHDCIVGKWCHNNSFSFLGGFVQLGDEVTLHTRSTILPRVKVRMGATLGVDSIVIKNAKPGITVYGNPAKELKF